MSKLFNKKAFVIAILRRGTYKYPPRNECLKKSRVDRNQYQCNHCKLLFTRKEVHIDHINPVVKISGFTTWDEYIDRMYPDESGFQTLCVSCHDNKTIKENEQRNTFKKKTLTREKRKDKIK